jgi:hypothetical protein
LGFKIEAAERFSDKQIRWVKDNGKSKWAEKILSHQCK